MPYDPNRHHRRSIRLKGYDYTQPGAYFVTIVTQHRECLFGEIVNGQMVLNEAGRIIQTVWDAIPEHHPGIENDAFVIMPNHIHGIVVITNVNASASASVGAGLVPAHMAGVTAIRATTRVAPTVGDVVGAFKSRTTVEYIRGVATYGWTPFPGKLWQRNYYEHIIRNEHALDRIREYIVCNPLRWTLDRENPQRMGNDEFDIWLEHYSDIRKGKPS